MKARAAALRLADPSLTPDVASILAQKQYTETEAARAKMFGNGSAPTPDQYTAASQGSIAAAGPVLGQRPQLPGGGFGPAGPIDVNSYAGSRYSPENTMRAALPAIAAAGPQPAAGSSPLDSRPSTLPAYPSGTVSALMAGAGHDPATNDVIRRQNFGMNEMVRQSQIDNRDSEIAARAGRAGDTAAELAARRAVWADTPPAGGTAAGAPGAAAPGAAAQPSGSPSVDAARAIMGPAAGAAGALPGAAAPGALPAAGAPAAPAPSPNGSIAAAGPSRADKYLHAGGKDPAYAKMLQEMEDGRYQPSFVPAETMGGPKGATVFRNSNKTAEVVKPATDKAQYPKSIDAGGRKLIEVAAGKFTDEQGKPVAWTDNERPMTVAEFMMSPSLLDKYGGDYGKFREDFDKLRKQGQAYEAKAGGAQPAGGAGAPAAKGAAIAVKSKAERDALPEGASYIGPDGKSYVKTAAKK